MDQLRISKFTDWNGYKATIVLQLPDALQAPQHACGGDSRQQTCAIHNGAWPRPQPAKTSAFIL